VKKSPFVFGALRFPDFFQFILLEKFLLGVFNILKKNPILGKKSDLGLTVFWALWGN